MGGSATCGGPTAAPLTARLVLSTASSSGGALVNSDPSDSKLALWMGLPLDSPLLPRYRAELRPTGPRRERHLEWPRRTGFYLHPIAVQYMPVNFIVQRGGT